MSAPWLSVLMPIHRGAATLPRTLASLNGQGPGIEVIAVVQDGRDGSRAMLEAVPGLRLIDAPGSTSWMQNTNIALRAAKAPLVTMLHQDDLWRPGHGAALRAAAQSPASLWICGADLIDAEDRTVGRMAPPFGPAPRQIVGAEALRHLLVQNTVALPSAMFSRAAALREGGLDETLWYTADWDLWLRLARSGPVAWDPAARVAFRIHAGSLTLTGSRDGAGFRQQLETPVARHLVALPAPERARIGRLAQSSNALNAALAGAYHGQRGDLARALRGIAALGPRGWHDFLRDTQIVARIWPRLRLTLQKRGAA